MRRQRDATRPGIEHRPRDIVPERRLRDILVAQVMDRGGDRRHRPPGVDQLAPALAENLPPPARRERDVLPPDLAHAMCGGSVAGGF
jgi:hypothetical protein